MQLVNRIERTTGGLRIRPVVEASIIHNANFLELEWVEIIAKWIFLQSISKSRQTMDLGDFGNGLVKLNPINFKIKENHNGNSSNITFGQKAILFYL